MIVGAVLGSPFIPYVQLMVRDAQGADRPINLVVDTGFDGFLALPQTWVDGLSLTPLGTGSITLSDKTSREVLLYETVVVWDGQERSVPVYGLDGDPLVGTALMYDYELTVQFVNGGTVFLRRMP